MHYSCLLKTITSTTHNPSEDFKLHWGNSGKNYSRGWYTGKEIDTEVSYLKTTELLIPKCSQLIKGGKKGSQTLPLDTHEFLPTTTWLHSRIALFSVRPFKTAMSFPALVKAKKEFSRNKGLSKNNQQFTLHAIKQKPKEGFSLFWPQAGCTTQPTCQDFCCAVQANSLPKAIRLFTNTFLIHIFVIPLYKNKQSNRRKINTLSC